MCVMNDCFGDRRAYREASDPFLCTGDMVTVDEVNIVRETLW